MAENHEYLLDGLDDSQRRAASALAGPVRIVAVAGAGKTRTITRRIAYGCASGKWDPDRTVAVTFSVKAAREMQERLSKLGVGRVQASTFHALALSQLRRVWSEVTDDYFPTLVPDPTPVLAGVVEKLTDLKGASSREVRDILAEVNWTKVSLITPSQYPRVAAAFHRVPPAGLSVEQMVAVLDDFERVKAEQHVMDFNDILLILSHILEESEEAARIVRREVGWLTVDEYQDVSPLQHRLMTLWLGTNTDVCVVGDPAQTIYSFTGATSYYLEEFPREFPGITADVELSRDYRSTGAIVKYANTLLRHSQQPDVYLSLESLEPSGAGDTEMPVNRHAYGTDAQEAKRVAGEIRKLLDSGVSAGEVAVLTRINAQIRTVNQACDDAGIPSMVRRVAGQGLEEGSFSQAVREGVSDGNIESLNTPMVTLSTIHAAKGLEWDHVFVIGVSEGLIPFGQSEDDAHLEEERRLLYVAVTRGRTSVSLSYARKKDETSSYERAPSRFLTR